VFILPSAWLLGISSFFAGGPPELFFVASFWTQLGPLGSLIMLLPRGSRSGIARFPDLP